MWPRVARCSKIQKGKILKIEMKGKIILVDEKMTRWAKMT